jgi:hypothetical protein
MSFLNLINNFGSNPNKDKPGKGKKQCIQCKEYIGVRSAICKHCKFSCEKQVSLFDKKYVYEHIRLDTEREKEQASRIIQNKSSLNNEFYWAPTSWRPLCYSEEDIRKRIKGFAGDLITLEGWSYVIIKCEPLNEFKQGSKREGRLQKLRVLDVIEIKH